VGLRYLTAIQPLFRAVHGQMEASVAAPAGDRAETTRAQDLAQVVESLATLERADRELGARLNTSDRIATVKRHADILRLELKGNRLVLDYSEDLGAMHADVTKVRQTLFNLLSNASKFTELMMPEMDGFTFATELRGTEEGRRLPIIVLTAKDVTPEDRQRLTGSVEVILQKGAASRETLLAEIRALVSTAARAHSERPKGT
jgi:CheY-like chemotaxis protein